MTLPNPATLDRAHPDVSRPQEYFSELARIIERLPVHAVEQMTDVLWRAYEEDRAVYVFGNGGSAALASHAACDLGKGTAVNGVRRFRVLSLTDNVPVLTALANDSSYEDIFAEQLLNLIRPLDIAFAISGSGNSPNVLKGLRTAKEAGARTIGLTGFQGGEMKALCDLCLVVPSDNMQFVEDLHLSVTHSIFTTIRHRVSQPTKAAAAF